MRRPDVLIQIALSEVELVANGTCQPRVLFVLLENVLVQLGRVVEGF